MMIKMTLRMERLVTLFTGLMDISMTWLIVLFKGYLEGKVLTTYLRRKISCLQRLHDYCNFFFLDVEIKFKQPFLLKLVTQLDIDLAIRWVSVGEVIIN